MKVNAEDNKNNTIKKCKPYVSVMTSGVSEHRRIV